MAAFLSDSEVDDIFEEIRCIFIQLEAARNGNIQHTEAMMKNAAEIKELNQNLEKLKFTNEQLEIQKNVAAETVKVIEKENTDLQTQVLRLKSQNEVIISEHDKLTVSYRHLQVEHNDLQKKHASILEKMTTWHRDHQEMAMKQTENQSTMLELAKQIGHAKATSLYVHQLKQQVDILRKVASDTVVHLQESRGRMKKEQDDRSAQVKMKILQENVPLTSPASSIERYWKEVTEKLKLESQAYKEELWTGLKALSHLKNTTQKSEDLKEIILKNKSLESLDNDNTMLVTSNNDD